MTARRLWMTLGLLLVSVAGAAAGHVVTARPASACSCASAEWPVLRQTITSSDPDASHRSFWPASGRLTSYTGRAHIWASQVTGGVISRAGAGQ
jgi:hypothetical protein